MTYWSPLWSYRLRENEARATLVNEVNAQTFEVLAAGLLAFLDSNGADAAGLPDTTRRAFAEAKLSFDRRADFIDWFMAFRKERQPTKPIVKQVELTNACPLKCVMCPRGQGKMTRKVGLMDVDTFRSICEELVDHQSFIGLHHFGESILHPDIGEMVAIAEGLGLRTGLSTNPSYMSEQTAEALLRSDISQITFCLDSLDNARFQLIRGTSRTVRQTIDKIAAFIERRKELDASTLISVQMIRMRRNLAERQRLLDLGRELGADRVTFVTFGQWDYPDAFYEEHSDEQKVFNDKPCYFYRHAVSILWDGRIVPCFKDYDGAITLGHVRDGGLQKVFESESYDRHIETHPKCTSCTESIVYKEHKRQTLGFTHYHRAREPDEDVWVWASEPSAERHRRLGWRFPDTAYRIGNLVSRDRTQPQ